MCTGPYYNVRPMLNKINDVMLKYVSEFIIQIFGTSAYCLNSFFLALASAVWTARALEMSVGKIPFLEALNGSTVMLPCTYSSCIGIKNLYFNWQFNDNGTMQKVKNPSF